MAEALDLDGAGVVVTGAASGIGAELARRFAARGARLVLVDRDAAGVTAVAAGLGSLPVAADVADRAAVAEAVEVAWEHLGGIDLFCGNAGVARGGTLEGDRRATPQDWADSWDVNVMAHVHATEALLPRWLARGRGHYLATVSAAGVLTMLGSAPYSVTKHGALALAEWLRATYDHRGVTVQALCPQGVRTPLLEGTGEIGRVVLEPGAVEVSVVGDAVLEALRDGRFLVLPHPEVAGYDAARAADRDGWLAGMNRLQQRLERA